MLKIAESDLLEVDEESLNALLERIKDDYKTEVIDGGTCYEVQLQDMLFKCAYSDDEMRGIIKTSIEIIKELIEIEAAGYTRERFDEVDAANSAEGYSPTSVMATFMDFKTDKLVQLIGEMAGYTRVGGAYFMLISSPELVNVIYGVFERMLDDYDDEQMWFTFLYFLIRGAMRMHSQELGTTNSDED